MEGILLHGDPPSDSSRHWRGKKNRVSGIWCEQKQPLVMPEVRPLKCIIYITQNPVTFVIQRHCELFLLDQQAREKKYSEAYKRHVHRPPKQLSTATMPKNTAHSRCDKTATLYSRR